MLLDKGHMFRLFPNICCHPANFKYYFFFSHDQESTHWDHPTMMDLLDSLTEFNHIKFSAYRTATKLRMLQKTLACKY